MPAPSSPHNSPESPTRFLSVQDGTLCEFCRDDELIQPIRARALSNLIQSSHCCELCAMWLRDLQHSRQNLEVRGQVAALRQHPLEQDLDDVKLVFLSSSKRPQIVWPHIGHVWAALDTIDIDDAKDINMKPLPRSDQDEITWKSVSEWLDQCEKHHEDCKHKKTSAWKPTRLLYICHTQGALQVRLVESQEIPDDAEYLTLSHCPGAENTLQLTRSNIEALKSSVPTGALSRIFIDACNTTKRLNHEYLWIDSFCIIQDDPTDWGHEVGRMASIFGNSWLNLSAVGDGEAGHGLFCPPEKRASRPWYPVYIHREWGEGFPSDYCVSESHNWWERISDSELNRGAWALQERILAPRVLHLGLEQVALECCSNAVCERLPYGDPTIRHDTAVMTSLKKFVLDARNGNLDNLTLEDVFRNWNKIVQAYAQGQLTVATDKLVAPLGLVDALYPVFQHMMESEDRVEVQTGDETQSQLGESSISSSGLFLAGLWRPHVEMQLVWRAMSRKYSFEYDGNSSSAPGRRYDEYIAPTWSWCSVKDAVIEPQEVRSVDIYFAKLIDASIVPHQKLNPTIPSSGLKYCSAPGSFLRLRCSFLPIAELGPENGMKLVNFEAATRERGWSDEAIDVQSKNYWDVGFNLEAINCKSTIAVPVFANMAYFTNPVHCLVLDERQDEKGNRWYVRVGAVVITQPDDVQSFWKGFEYFDKLMPGQCEKFDGLYRFKELERNKSKYLRMDGVLQRVVEIR